MFKLKPHTLALLGSLAVLVPVHGSAPDRVGAYDFSYQSTGDSRVKPAQVFDNGQSTYFQFRPGEPVPAILGVTPAGPVLLVPEFEGPYVRVPAVGSAFVLRLGLGVGRVAYIGDGRLGVGHEAAETTPAAADLGNGVARQRLLAAASQVQGLPASMLAPAPQRPIDLTVDSYATPLRGDRVQWTSVPVVSSEFEVPFIVGSDTPGPMAKKVVRAFAASSKAAQKIVVKGIDDKSYKEGLAERRAKAVVDLLVSAGIPRDSVEVQLSALPRDGSVESGIVGATLVSHTSKAYEPAVQRSAGGGQEAAPDQAIGEVVQRLRAGQISAGQAAQDLMVIDQANKHLRPPSGPSAPSVPAGRGSWDIRLSDQNFGNMLKRWGEESGWRVVLKGAPDIRITADDSIRRPDFLQAADYAVTQAKRAGFAIKATAYSNHVLLLTEDKE